MPTALRIGGQFVECQIDCETCQCDETLATAHSIGFGIYRPDGLVQHFEDPQLWEEIGYQRDAGSLQLGSYVELSRSGLSSPAYFVELLHSEDAVVFEAIRRRAVSGSVGRAADPQRRWGCRTRAR
jgi:hypothetical protein